MRLLSRGVRKKAKGLGIRYSFLFMRAQGQQLSEITSLIESGVIRPVVDKVFPFEKTGDALGLCRDRAREGQGRHHGRRLEPPATSPDVRCRVRRRWQPSRSNLFRSEMRCFIEGSRPCDQAAITEIRPAVRDRALFLTTISTS